MDELIRRALLGVQEAQRECTEKGIVLPCPRCGKGGASTQYVMGDYWYECPHCHSASGFHSSAEVALADWNTRPAPPIGRCGECSRSKVEWTGERTCNLSLRSVTVQDDYFCASFKPKEDNSDG